MRQRTRATSSADLAINQITIVERNGGAKNYYNYSKIDNDVRAEEGRSNGARYSAVLERFSREISPLNELSACNGEWLRESMAATLPVQIYGIVRLRPLRSGYSPRVIPPSRLWRAFSRVRCDASPVFSYS